MSKKIAAVIYPHQLWQEHPAIRAAKTVVLVEDPLFFRQYNFHCQKLILHRASMTEFLTRCKKAGKQVQRIESRDVLHSGDIGKLLSQQGIHEAVVVDPTDDWLKKRVTEGCQRANVVLHWLEDPAFMTPTDVIERWAAGRQHFHFTDFYTTQRKRLGILLDEKGKPTGGKWTFDTENRKRLPKSIEIPEISPTAGTSSLAEAKRYVSKEFPLAIGTADHFGYPVTHEDAADWLDDFVEHRLASFGDYEDAISSRETFIFHSVLTPMLNIGLLTPMQIVEAVLAKAEQAPINSLEGFLRQVIGWREFIRLVYRHVGSRQRISNRWQLKQSLPSSFYCGNTGIAPVDCSIQRLLRHAYCHHIERLMILGNFMLLCDIRPDDVYRWFMELFIDSYDWVMVPNVYGMSQYADGGLMTTKPYISGSAYVLKMSDFAKGPWCEIWDALYWRFIARECEFFGSNPRMRVMVGQLDRMGPKLDQHLAVADRFLSRLHG